MKHSNKILIFIIVFCMGVGTSAFAAWWGTPGYEWALKNNITSRKTQQQLYSEVELDDLYSTILKYLNLKGIMARNVKVHHEDKLNELDNVARGIVDIVNGYNSRDKLNIQQFYIVENYCEKGYELLEKYKGLSQYLTREELQNLEIYLKLSKYKAAMLVEKRSDRDYALSRVGWVKNSKIINYGMMPYAEKISRKEFLLVIFDLMSDGGASWADDSKLQSFEDADVLIGYDIGLELDKNINYVEMYSFLQRLEYYDFNTHAEKTELSDLESYINRAVSNDISKSELISYLNELYYNTDSQVDILTIIEKELGSSWTVKEAGDLMQTIYRSSGFSYKDGNTIVRVGGK